MLAAWLHFDGAKMIINNQVRPGRVGSQKGEHAGSGIHRHALRIHGLGAQIEQTWIMSHVRMGEQDASHGRVCGELIILGWKIGRGVDEPALPGGPIHESQTHHMLPRRRSSAYGLTMGAMTPRLGRSPILGYAQQHCFDSHRQ